METKATKDLPCEQIRLENRADGQKLTKLSLVGSVNGFNGWSSVF